jgi:SAM-dependent methyltransferase
LFTSLKSLVHGAGRWYIRRICLNEYQSQVPGPRNERSIEYGFALRGLAKNRASSVLDVGTGTTAWPHLLRNCGYVVTAIDNVTDYWPQGMVNRHWPVLDVDITKPDSEKLREKYDAITCISVVEHIKDHVTAVQNMTALLKTGAILILTTPFSCGHSHPNVYSRPDALWGKDLPYICRSSSSAELQEWLDSDLSIEQRELWQLFTGPVWATGERCEWRRAETEDEPHQLGCFLFRKK